jgi:hypothetical protein
VQYKSWLEANKGSDFTYEDWHRYILQPKLDKAAEQINRLSQLPTSKTGWLGEESKPTD